MKRHIFDWIDIKTFNTDFIDCKAEQNSFFELVFVEKGKGFRTLDDFKLPFKKDNFFLHLPNERNSIHLEETSLIHFIKFQKGFFSQKASKDFSVSDWFTNVEFILNSNQQKEETIIKSKEEIEIVKSLVRLLLYEHKLITKDTNLKPLLVALLNVIARNILPLNYLINNDFQSASIQNILNYIYLHICDKTKLSIKNISNEFCISANYFSEYFATNTSISYKQYILEYKIKSAENRLKYSSLTISQIALELGFTDISHLNKTYKKMKGIYPREVRSK